MQIGTNRRWSCLILSGDVEWVAMAKHRKKSLESKLRDADKRAAKATAKAKWKKQNPLHRTQEQAEALAQLIEEFKAEKLAGRHFSLPKDLSPLDRRLVIATALGQLEKAQKPPTRRPTPSDSKMMIEQFLENKGSLLGT